MVSCECTSSDKGKVSRIRQRDIYSTGVTDLDSWETDFLFLGRISCILYRAMYLTRVISYAYVTRPVISVSSDTFLVPQCLPVSRIILRNLFPESTD